jgi:hypothetical protein
MHGKTFESGLKAWNTEKSEKADKSGSGLLI